LESSQCVCAGATCTPNVDCGTFSNPYCDPIWNKTISCSCTFPRTCNTLTKQCEDPPAPVAPPVLPPVKAPTSAAPILPPVTPPVSHPVAPPVFDVNNVTEIENPVNVTGNYTQHPNATLIVHPGGLLNIFGCAFLSGNLVLNVSQQSEGSSIDVAYFACRNGTFDSISLIGGDSCYLYNATPTYTNTKLSILVEVMPSGTCGPSAGSVGEDRTTMSIAIGVSIGGAVLIAIILILLFAFVPSLRKCARPYARRNEPMVAQ